MFAGGHVYERLGVRPVINAQGNGTVLGGSTPPKAVLEAMDEANLSFVEMRELLEKAGEYIAGVLGTEAAFVTSGCAAALTLSTAACLAGTDLEKIGRLPDTTGMKNQVLIQKKQRYGFDRCYTIPGSKLVEVGDENGCTPEQLDEAIGPDTAAIAYYVEPFWDSSVVSLEEAVRVAHARGVPVIADAASQIYPLDYFRSTAQAADVVCFGAKYFGAPHSSGVVAGTRELVDAVVAQGFIAYHLTGRRSFGRPMKLDRQEVVGVVSALDGWFSMNHEDRFLQYDRRFSAIQQGLRGVHGLEAKVVRNHRFFQHTLHVVVDTGAVGKSAQQITDELDAGNPRIWVGVEGENTITVNVHTLNDGEEATIVDRLRDALAG
jgi:L-seryl-tRNA(Ser) seleniumtransferase